VAVYVAHAV